MNIITGQQNFLKVNMLLAVDILTTFALSILEYQKLEIIFDE